MPVLHYQFECKKYLDHFQHTGLSQIQMTLSVCLVFYIEDNIIEKNYNC